MKFVVDHEHDQVERLTPSHSHAIIHLVPDSWDDFGFKTTFAVTAHVGASKVYLGRVKILQRGQESGATPLPGLGFASLGQEYVSLGQESSYYDRLVTLFPPTMREEYLRGMQDLVYDQDLAAAIEHEPGVNISLLRFGEAQPALDYGRQILAGHRPETGRLDFQVVWTVGDGNAIEIPFVFEPRVGLPSRCIALVGNNGSGKTSLLADIAIALRDPMRLHGSSRRVMLMGNRTFPMVIAISFSAFDDFAIPTPEENFGYVYLGLRRFEPDDVSENHELKSLGEIRQEFAESLRAVLHDSQRINALMSAASILDEDPSFGRLGITPSLMFLDPSLALYYFENLSTGHKVLLNVVTQLAAHLERGSLVLFDEPETHLHPPLISAMLQCIQALLSTFNSFALIATHSPVVLQEIPASNVKIVERFNNFSVFTKPEIETYGESIGAITKHIFGLGAQTTTFHKVLQELSSKYTMEELDTIFQGGLSAQARAIVVKHQRLIASADTPGHNDVQS